MLAEPVSAPHATTARARAKGIAFRALVAELDHSATPYVAAVEPRENYPLPPADMAGIVSLYGLLGWTERDGKPVKHKLVWADFQFRSGQAIQREPLPRRVRPAFQRP
ncbi:hypothetical protein IPZ58_15815 [Streptomyces roseoverticillatus]|uniref:hypothetical protein n=1 Tax=Streptomyces roseoverticillatus TaxID=66429 RepID=UPI001F44CC91|nr:hypothetical protein [Streptomyces roseoverticillatus]MCF3103042.1 hypothetical protein [Streptomyces roseoverticillatus]